MAKISENLQKMRDAILEEGEGGGPVSQMVLEQSMAAITGGMASADWVIYMNNFVSHPDQLRRLAGRDTNFMGTPWGRQLLAYIVAAGPCTQNTGLSLVTDDLSQEMKDRLDDGMPE